MLRNCKVIGVANGAGDIIVVPLTVFYGMEFEGIENQLSAIEFGYVDA